LQKKKSTILLIDFHIMSVLVSSNRNVVGAVGWNPICIIIPCHRVVGANSNLTGYGGGIQNKIRLLQHEKHNMDKFTIPKNII